MFSYGYHLMRDPSAEDIYLTGGFFLLAAVYSSLLSNIPHCTTLTSYYHLPFVIETHLCLYIMREMDTRIYISE